MERTEKKKNLILPALILLLGLAYILWAVPLQGGNLDSRILLFLQENIRNPVCNLILIAVTTLGNAGAIWIAGTAVLCICKRTRRIGIICACSLAAAFLINNLFLKNLVGRIRPYEMIAGLQPLIARLVDPSFPSGHTSSGFSVAWVLLRTVPKRYGIPAVCLAACIGFSRLYVGVHYPTDVLVGMVIGIGCAYLAEFLVTRYEQKKARDKWN